jgi:hypothetical protein
MNIEQILLMFWGAIKSAIMWPSQCGIVILRLNGDLMDWHPLSLVLPILVTLMVDGAISTRERRKRPMNEQIVINYMKAPSGERVCVSHHIDGLSKSDLELALDSLLQEGAALNGYDDVAVMLPIMARMGYEIKLHDGCGSVLIKIEDVKKDDRVYIKGQWVTVVYTSRTEDGDSVMIAWKDGDETLTLAGKEGTSVVIEKPEENEDEQKNYN